jgi:hypothetical protein
MKAKLTGKILSVDISQGEARLSIESTGKVDTRNIAAQEVVFNGTIRMKALIANDMKIGANITITVSDEESNEGSV